MSVPTSGIFDCSKLLEVKAKLSDIWNSKKAIQGASYIADVEPALAILQNQTANFSLLTDPDKDRDGKIYWVDACSDEEPVSCTDQCTMDGDPIGDNCVDITLTECFEVTFSVTERMFRTSNLTMEEVVAVAQLNALNRMDELWAAKSIAHFNMSAGVNSHAGEHTVAGATTTIAPTAWNEDIMGYIDEALWMNKGMNMSRMLSGTLLKRFFWKVGMEQSNPEGAAAYNKLHSFGIPYFDRRMDNILGQKALFLFNPDSVALVTKARHPEEPRVVPTEDGPQTWYRQKSNNLPGVVYDAAYKEICRNDDIHHFWKFKTRGDHFLNPLGCDNNRTGVLKFVCG